MGMHATARLWYGVYGAVPDAARTELEEPEDNPYGEKVIDGVHVHMVYAYDRELGAGATIAFNWWGDETTVDLDQIDALEVAVDKFLDEYDVPGKRGIYLTANYS